MGGMVVATFSIVAADLEAGDFGVAVASKFLAVGAIVPWAGAGAGAVATQSYANTGFGPDGLALMCDGASAEQALRRLIADDAGRDRRQVGMVDARGGSAAHTGADCPAWAGHRIGRGFACQGNLLAGAGVVDSMASSFEGSSGTLAERLLEALAAGERAGGDRRGRQAAALYVARDKAGYLGFSDILVDLRADDHSEPVGELRRLLDLQSLYFGKSPPGDRLAIAGPLLLELQQMMRRSRHLSGEAKPDWTREIEHALDSFFGTENLEERIDLRARTVDRPALDFLRRTFAAR